ncbi:hypothetical protein C0431_12640 [bacterium]|nr:hypothetical protein [bacterium]
MSLRERLATKHILVFTYDPLENVTAALDIDNILEFAEDGISRLNEIKKALDTLGENPSAEDMGVFHDAVNQILLRDIDI